MHVTRSWVFLAEIQNCITCSWPLFRVHWGLLCHASIRSPVSELVGDLTCTSCRFLCVPLLILAECKIHKECFLRKLERTVLVKKVSWGPTQRTLEKLPKQVIIIKALFYCFKISLPLLRFLLRKECFNLGSHFKQTEYGIWVVNTFGLSVRPAWQKLNVALPVFDWKHHWIGENIGCISLAVRHDPMALYNFFRMPPIACLKLRCRFLHEIWVLLAMIPANT